FDLKSYIAPPTPFPDWPRAEFVKWELRKYNVLNYRWLTALGAYCYSDRVFYQDAETNLLAPFESYDRNGKYWKVVWFASTPINFRLLTIIMTSIITAKRKVFKMKNHHIRTTAESKTANDVVGAGS